MFNKLLLEPAAEHLVWQVSIHRPLEDSGQVVGDVLQLVNVVRQQDLGSFLPVKNCDLPAWVGEP